ncbi:uncharacterized protein METZ01_LOCUS340463, partial [marine metagenome]
VFGLDRRAVDVERRRGYLLLTVEDLEQRVALFVGGPLI